MAKKQKEYDNAADGWKPDPDPTDKDLLPDSGILDTLFLDEDGEISLGKMITYVIIGTVIAIALNWNTIKKEWKESHPDQTTAEVLYIDGNTFYSKL
jgi:hypothetical protein